jgi:glucose/mannose-6-phosphate isomerase
MPAGRTLDAGVLDDPVRIASLDPSDALAQAAGLGRQLRRGYVAGKETKGLPEGEGLRSVVVCGMGGSGVAGDVLRGLYADRAPLPIVVSKGYVLPEFAGPHTIVTALSFSGNTEETLAAYGEAVTRGCRVVTVSAGGALADRAAADGVAHVPLPTDVPMPRMAVGDLTASLIGALEAVGVVPSAHEEVDEAAALLDDLGGRLGADRPTAENPAKDLAAWIGPRTPVVWGSEGLAEAPAGRFRTQVNENAKSPAFSAVLSELDHNEIEGWSAGAGEGYAVVALRHTREHPRVGDRLAATLEAIDGAGLDIRELHGEGRSAMDILFSLLMLGDFAATYLALLRGVDPTPVPVLMTLKERLAR